MVRNDSLQMADRVPGDPYRAGLEVKHLQRYPVLVTQPDQRVQQCSKIVIRSPRMPSIHLVDMHMPDEIKVALHQHWMRLGLINRVMSVEHRANPRAVN